ncbi:MAG: hypothetical protein AABX73_01765 [Nanoarchaeota archaeon]
MKVVIGILKFLFLGALFIVSNENLHLINREEFVVFSELFYNWINTLFSHTLQITGFVVNSEWVPQTNRTFFGIR